MKSKLTFPLGVLLILAAALMSCGKKQETSGVLSSRSFGGCQARRRLDDRLNHGTVQLDGKPPRMKVINMSAEPKCAQAHSSPPDDAGSSARRPWDITKRSCLPTR